MPHFLIIGAQRCGTSSLYRYLGAHPNIIPALRKETEYLSRRFSRGEMWYRAHFPLQARLSMSIGNRKQTFEATPDYLFYPFAAERASQLVPHAKLIVLLRDPVERAFSHYRHMVRLGFETLSFEAALDAEPTRLAPDFRALEQEPLHYSTDLLRFSYVARGLYLDQLERWMQRFSPDRFLILRSEDFFAEPAKVFKQILEFLELPAWTLSRPENFSYRTPRSAMTEPIPAVARSRLRRFFRPHNERLYAKVGRDFGWGGDSDTKSSDGS